MTSQPSQLSQNLSPEVQAPSMNYPGQEVQKSDDNVIVQENTENIDSIDNFDDMELKETLLRGIYAFGYEKNIHCKLFLKIKISIWATWMLARLCQQHSENQ